MKFGTREICNVVFKAKNDLTIGSATFTKGQPVLYIDTAKTSTIEGAATTVYATGGPGNTRLVAWEGERTLTFTVEDALLSPISFSMLSGAGVLKAASTDSTTKVHVHASASATTNYDETNKTYIDLTDAMLPDDQICGTAPIFVSKVESDGSLTGTVLTGFAVGTSTATTAGGTTIAAYKYLKQSTGTAGGDNVFVDFYVIRNSNKVNELQIDMEHFGGYFYVEAATLWRDTNGGDHAVEITFPNVKIQSNFTFNQAATGDPSTFSFVMDAFPGYTWFNPNKKVLLAMQVMDDVENASATSGSVFTHAAGEDFDGDEDGDGTDDYFADSVGSVSRS